MQFLKPNCSLFYIQLGNHFQCVILKIHFPFMSYVNLTKQQNVLCKSYNYNKKYCASILAKLQYYKLGGASLKPH